MSFQFTLHLHRRCRLEKRSLPTRGGAPRLHAAWNLAFAFTVLAHLFIAHGAGGEWPLVEAFHQGVVARCNDMVMLALVGWPNSVAMAAELWTASERGLPMLLVPRRQPRTPGFADVAIEAKS